MQRIAAAIVALTLLALGWQLAIRDPHATSGPASSLEPDAAEALGDIPSAQVDVERDLAPAVDPSGRVTHGDATPGVVRVPLLRLDPADDPEPDEPAVPPGRLRLFGRVTDEAGAPVAGVVVRAEQRVRSGSAVAQARTDADGAYSLLARLRSDVGRRRSGGSARHRREDAAFGFGGDVRLALLEQLGALDGARPVDGEFEVSVEDVRGLRAEQRFVPERGERERRVDLAIRREFPFAGTVLDGSEPVPHATVLLFDAERELLGSTTADADGEFELRAPPAGRFELLARAQGRGAAGLGGVSLGPGQRSLRQDVALAGTGVLRGRVRYPSGEPVVGLELRGVLESLAARNPGLPQFPSPQQLLEEEFGGGLALSGAMTEEDGRFRMEGLQPGSYHLALALEGTGADPDGLYRTGKEHAIVFPSSRVIVAVIEGGGFVSGGSRLASGTVRVHCVRAGWSDLPPGTPTGHQVALAGSGLASFLVGDAHDWVVFVEHEGRVTPETPVRFRKRPGDGVAQVDLTPEVWTSAESLLAALAPPEERARFEVVVRDPDGERLDAELWLWRREEEGWVPAYERRLVGEGKGLGALRPGTYRYRLRVARAAGQFWVSPGFVPLDLPPGSNVQHEVEARPELLVVATLAWEDGRDAAEGARKFEAELLPVARLDEVPRRRSTALPLLGSHIGALAFGSEQELDFDVELDRVFLEGRLQVGQTDYAGLRQLPGAYRLRLRAVDDPSERYEATFPLRDDEINHLRFLLPSR